MAFTPGNQTIAINSINSAIKYKHLTPEQGALIKKICNEVKVPTGSELYIGFDAFCEFLSQAIPYSILLINARSTFKRAYPDSKLDDIRKGLIGREVMSAFKTRIGKVPNFVAAVIKLNRDLPGITLFNSVAANKFHNMTKDMGDVDSEVIYPKATTALLGIKLVDKWKNPTLAIVTKKNMSIFIPFLYMHTFAESTLATNTPIIFNFFPIDGGVESKTLIIEPYFLANAKNINNLNVLLTEYGYMDKDWLIGKVEVLNFFTTAVVTIIKVN